MPNINFLIPVSYISIYYRGKKKTL